MKGERGEVQKWSSKYKVYTIYSIICKITLTSWKSTSFYSSKWVLYKCISFHPISFSSNLLPRGSVRSPLPPLHHRPAVYFTVPFITPQVFSLPLSSTTLHLSTMSNTGVKTDEKKQHFDDITSSQHQYPTKHVSSTHSIMYPMILTVKCSMHTSFPGQGR